MLMLIIYTINYAGSNLLTLPAKLELQS